MAEVTNRASWIASANSPGADFPLANLPYGVFTHPHSTRIGVAIGDQILDLRAAASEALLKGLPGVGRRRLHGVRPESADGARGRCLVCAPPPHH